MIQNHIKKKIQEKVISLEKFGINDLVWEKEDAKKLITSLMTDEIGILGGDVYIIDSNRLIPTYDNWSCDSKSGETKSSYFTRSKQKAFNYIDQYPLDENQNILFSLVFTEIID